MYAQGYRCFACAEVQTIDFAGSLCPRCGGNLDITYDYAAAAEAIGETFPDNGPGLFRYRALLPLNPSSEPFPLRIGGTPLYPARRLGERAGLQNLYLKDETGHPSASLKDRASAVAVSRALETGAETVATASTGNAGSSLACVAAATGLRAVVFVPESAPIAKLTQLLSYGARVLAVRGSYDEAFDLCLAACDEFGWFNRSTGFNPYTREGKKTCAFEIWEDLGGRVPDRVVVPTGDGNILSAVWKGWLELKAVGLTDRLPRVDCAQSASSDAISRTVQKLRDGGEAIADWSAVRVDEVRASTLADSISVDRPRDGLAAVRAVIESRGASVAVPDAEILAAIPEMARLTGVFPEPAAAAPWAALKQIARERRVAADELVVCLVTGNGLKDVAHAGQAAGAPTVIEPSLAAVRNAFPAA